MPSPIQPPLIATAPVAPVPGLHAPLARPAHRRRNALLAACALWCATVSALARADDLRETVQLTIQKFDTSVSGRVSPGRHDIYTFRAPAGTHVAFTLHTLEQNAVLQVRDHPQGDPRIRLLRMPATGEIQVAVVSTRAVAHYKLDTFTSEQDASAIVKQYYLAQQNLARVAAAQTVVPTKRPPVKPFTPMEIAIGVLSLAIAGLMLWLAVRLATPPLKRWLRTRPARRADSRP